MGSEILASALPPLLVDLLELSVKEVASGVGRQWLLWP